MSDSRPESHGERDASNREGGRLRDFVRVYSGHDEARRVEIARQAARTPYQRLKQFMELQRRIWGEDNPDVRESEMVNIERRDS